jgi:N-acetylglucosaminyl-diphospho-decaprenol L-rhamnosyltransferase
VPVTVVIITRDRASDLAATLRRRPAGHPVIVVDNGSAGGPAAVPPGVRTIALDADRGAAARTHGVLAARTPYVAFCDDDSWWEPGALERAAALLDAAPGVGLLAARVLLPGGRLEPACAAMASSPLPGAPGLPGPRVLGFVACGAVVRRDAYLAAGGFPPGWGIGGEEAPLAARLSDLGWDLVYAPELVVHHHPSRLRDPAARQRIAARNDLWTAWGCRPAAAALRATARELGRAVRHADRRRGILQATRGAPAVLRARRVAGPRTAAELDRLDRATSAPRSG